MARTLTLLLAVLAALGLAAPASAGWADDARVTKAGLAASVREGRLTAGEAYRYRVAVRRARAVLPRLSWPRAANLGAVLHDVAAQSRRFSRPRALALFSMLRVNTAYLRNHALPPAKTDVVGSGGVVYRSFPGQGLQFHPLGAFGRLNALLTGGRIDAAARLAAALRLRGISRPERALVWEYYFPFGAGRAPWTSGMAQAVAAQALARAGSRLGNAGLIRAAGRAYRGARSGLVMHLSAGPWVKHYSFSGLVVLNSQLQTAISIAEYAGLAADAPAKRFATRLRASSRAMLPRFDTGYWSLYSLGVESPLTYHLYVVSLLRKLASRTGAASWADAAERFDRYTHEPPKLVALPFRKLLYPWPADGFRDGTSISFWLSKPSTVTLRIGGERRTLFLGGGRHGLRWDPGRRRPGAYRPYLAAVDLAGNRTTLALPAIHVAVDRDPPDLSARMAGRRLYWSAIDGATPWLRLTVRLVRGARSRRIPLGTRPLRGSARIDLPRLRWVATLVASDSSGNRSRVLLGTVGGAGG